MGLEWRKKKGGGVEGVKDFVGGVLGECELEVSRGAKLQ